jgi:hypothetical protein
LSVATLILVFVAVSGAATKGGPPSGGPYLVTSTISNTDVVGNSTLVQADDAITNPTGSGTYSPGVDNVISQIDTNGGEDWNLDLRNSPRGFYLTLITTAGNQVPGFPVGPLLYSGRIISRCFTPSGGTSGFSWLNITGADPNCAMRVNFTSGLTSYTLVMSPGYSGTGLAEVYCNATNGASCVDWTVVPNMNAPNGGVANLYSIGKGGKEVFVGTLALSYRIHVTLP